MEFYDILRSSEIKEKYATDIRKVFLNLTFCTMRMLQCMFCIRLLNLFLKISPFGFPYNLPFIIYITVIALLFFSLQFTTSHFPQFNKRYSFTQFWFFIVTYAGYEYVQNTGYYYMCIFIHMYESLNPPPCQSILSTINQYDQIFSCQNAYHIIQIRKHQKFSHFGLQIN